MKKLRVLLASVLVLIMALGVTACGGNDAFAGDYKEQASADQVQNLAEKIEGKAQATDILGYEMVLKQTIDTEGMKTETNLTLKAAGTSAADLKMSGDGTSKVTMGGQSMKGDIGVYMTDGWMYMSMEIAGYTEKYKMELCDPSMAGNMAGGAAQTSDLSVLLEDETAKIYIDEQADGTTKVKAVYMDKVEGVNAEMTMYFLLDAEGNTTAIKLTCDTSTEEVAIKINMTMTAKDITVTVPNGLAEDSSYEEMM